MREKALRNESLDQNNAKDCLQSCGYSGKWTSFLPFRVQLQDVRHRAQKWNVGPERRKERETFCGRFGKRTPFLRWRARLHKDVNAYNYEEGSREQVGSALSPSPVLKPPIRLAMRVVFFIRKSNKFSPLK